VRPPLGLARLLADKRRRLDRRKATGVTVAELMSAPPVTIREDQSLAEAATRMYQHGVKRLPVVDQAGVLVGIVTRGDLLKAYLRADQDIRQDIRRRAVPKVVERAVETVQVQVHDGTVELDGWLTRRSQALALIAHARATDGVISVHSNLGYDVNDTSDWASRDPLPDREIARIVRASRVSPAVQRPAGLESLSPEPRRAHGQVVNDRPTWRG
jgi:predicted transcriptional regulator